MAPVPSVYGVARTAIRRPSAGGQRTANAGGGVSGGGRFEELRTGRPSEMNSLTSTSTSVISCDSRSFWQPITTVGASSPERDWGMTPIHRTGGPGSFPTMAKRTTSTLVQVTRTESRQPETPGPRSHQTVVILLLKTGLTSFNSQ